MWVSIRCVSSLVLLLIAYRLPSQLCRISQFNNMWRLSLKANRAIHLLRKSFNCLRLSHFMSKCPSQSRCTHCCCMHHSLLHFTATTTKAPIDRALKVDDSRTVSNTFSAMVANIQNVQAEVMPVKVLLVTAWVDTLYTPEGRCFKSELYLIRDQLLALFPNLSVRLCERSANAQISKALFWR